MGACCGREGSHTSISGLEQEAREVGRFAAVQSQHELRVQQHVEATPQLCARERRVLQSGKRHVCVYGKRWVETGVRASVPSWYVIELRSLCVIASTFISNPATTQTTDAGVSTCYGRATHRAHPVRHHHCGLNRAHHSVRHHSSTPTPHALRAVRKVV